ncbi:tetratricopeptide repeat protein [Streptomyces hypolithicus]
MGICWNRENSLDRKNWGIVMRHFTVSAGRGVVGFAPVKALISATDTSRWPREALIGLKLIAPDDPSCSAIDNEASLTDAAQAQDRIRFFLKDRLTRSFRDVGRAWLSAIGPCAVEVTHSEFLDEGSRLFLETLAHLPGGQVEVRFQVGQSAADPTTRASENVREQRVNRLVAQVDGLTGLDLDFLYEEAMNYLSVGDSWTAEKILRAIQPHRDVPTIWGRLGLAYTMLGRTLEAEFCYLRWREDTDPVGVAGADYALSMLYARHHPAHLRSLDRTAEYLEHGYAALCQVGEDDTRDLTFQRVFNRNGYALVEFRRGQIEEAIAHLTNGISQLRSGSAVHHMHQTVLIYNLAQCYRRIGRIDSAIETYSELLGVDGKMPEYHMELAHCYLSTEQFDQALASLLEARNLGPSIQEVNSLLGQ